MYSTQKAILKEHCKVRHLKVRKPSVELRLYLQLHVSPWLLPYSADKDIFTPESEWVNKSSPTDQDPRPPINSSPCPSAKSSTCAHSSHQGQVPHVICHATISAHLTWTTLPVVLVPTTLRSMQLAASPEVGWGLHHMQHLLQPVQDQHWSQISWSRCYV